MSSPIQNKPESYFRGFPDRLIVDEDEFTGLNVGFESLRWRYEDFAEYLFEWLMDFAVKFSDLEKVNPMTCRSLIRRAAKMVYSTDKSESRGEFGELMLHAFLRELFDTQAVVKKLYLKSAFNETVKGFDAVHVRKAQDGDLELWLGEVKFYSEINSAIREVSKEIVDHLAPEKLHEEFICVGNHVESGWEYAEKVKKMLSPRVTLDEIFDRICVPVLLTYESAVVRNAKAVSDDFLKGLKQELYKHAKKFNTAIDGVNVKVHLILLPLDSKKELIRVLDEKLKGQLR